MTRLDSRTWCCWALAAMVPLLVSRHPVVIAELLIIVLIVRWLCLPRGASNWSWIVRIAILFAAISVVFNALTVRSGNQIAFALLRWDVTWNAIVYGVVSGFAMVAIVLIGVTTAAALDWVALIRVVPSRFAPLAAAGSVAWSFLPGASQALTDIREAQAARGHRLRGGRDLLPIVVPLLDTSLSRALAMSEALEVRGFGAGAADVTSRSRGAIAGPGLLIVGSLVAIYAFSLGDTAYLWPAVGVSGVGLVLMLTAPSSGRVPTRYREHRLTRADKIVIAMSLAASAAFVAVWLANPDGVSFSPYPDLAMQAPDYRAILALALLLAPAAFPVKPA